MKYQVLFLYFFEKVQVFPMNKKTPIIYNTKNIKEVFLWILLHF